jgi:predicted permease
VSGGERRPPPGTEPPRAAEWLIERVLPADARPDVLADLGDRYRFRAERDGIGREGVCAARRWYWRQAFSFVVRVPVARLWVGGRGGRFGLASDLRIAVRTLRRRPGLTLTATGILALAIGASTTVFGVVEAVLLRQLPYPDPDRLVMLWDAVPDGAGAGREMPIAFDHVREWSGRSEWFSAVGAYESVSPMIRAGEWPERVEGAFVSPGLLPALGARPLLGRLLRTEDSEPGAAPVVLLSHGLWRDRFGGDPRVVGREIELNGAPTRVIGVLPPDFWFYDPYSATRSITGRSSEAARLWLPLPSGGMFAGDEDYPRYRVIARLTDGVTVDEVREAAGALRRRLAPTSSGDGAELRLVSLAEQVVAEARPRLLGLAGAAALVLLIACVNQVALLTVHHESRRSELAVRAALGAGSGRIGRQLVVESTLLALAGGAVGLVLAVFATDWLVGRVPRGLPLAHRVGIHGTVAAFGVALSLAVGLGTGVVATARLAAGRLAAGLSAGDRTSTRGRSTRRLHGALVAAEVALSLTLLVSATLLLRSLVGLQSTDTGFDAEGVLTFQALVQFETLVPEPGEDRRYALFQEIESRLAALPEVFAAGGTTALPFSRWSQGARVALDASVPDGATGSGGGAGGESAAAEGPGMAVAHRLVSPGYFGAIGLPVRAGRGIETTDREGAPAVAVVNEAFVERVLGARADVLGRTVTVTRGRNVSRHTIVGVVPNVKHSELFETPDPILYAPLFQAPVPFLRFAVRARSGDPLALVESVRRTVAEIDPDLPLESFISFEALVAQSIEEERFYAEVVGAFAAVGVLLTLIGLYGVVSYATRQRDKEIGVRVALGAGAGSVHRLVLGQGLVPVAVGLGVGWLCARAATRLLGGLLHGIPPQDAVSFGLATGVFGVVAAAACLVPARRAVRVDPVRVLRGE